MEISPTSGDGVPSPNGQAPSGNGSLFSEDEWTQLREQLKLTERQSSVLQGVLQGESDQRIALDLGISSPTVRTHLQRMFQRMDVGDRVGLVVAVFKAFRESS